jgi:GNAT superfamily N-acetyltransferase
MKQSTETWQRAVNQDLRSLMDFLLPQEWRAVPFTSRLLRQGRPVLPTRFDGAVVILRDQRDTGAAIEGAILRTNAGLLLPVMPYAPGPVPDRLARLEQLPRPETFLPQLFRERVYSIMGSSAEVRWLETGMESDPVASIDYTLMTLGEGDFRRRKPPDEPPPAGLRLRQAEARDLPPLFPLQRAYELEEVVVFPERFSDQSCRLNLRRTLRQQLVFMAELDGRAIAKAGTNARGFQVDQIGGVYTYEAHRGGGIATRVMSELLERIFRTKRMASLFVKLSNRPAIALYHKLGFRSLDSYRISYFQQ